MMEWVRALESRFDSSEGDAWRVNRTEIPMPNGGHVSTVFLGLDHSFGTGVPLLFESMYFPEQRDGMLDEDCERCSTWEEAEQQHINMVNKYTKEKL